MSSTAGASPGVHPLLAGAYVNATLGSGSNGVVLSGSVSAAVVAAAAEAGGSDSVIEGGTIPADRTTAITSGALVPRDTFVAFKIMSHFWSESAKALLDCERRTLLHLAPHPSIIRTFAAFTSGIPSSLAHLLTEDMKNALAAGSSGDDGSSSSSPYSTQVFIQEYHPTTLEEFMHVLPLPAPWHVAWRLAWDLVSVMAHMHAARTAHLDFKSDNILVAYDGRAVLTDFGISRVFDAESGGPAAGSADGDRSAGAAVQAVEELAPAAAAHAHEAAAASTATPSPLPTSSSSPDSISLRLPYHEPFDLLMNTYVLAPEVLSAYNAAAEAWKAGKAAGKTTPRPEEHVLDFTDQGMWSAAVILYEVITGLSFEPKYPADGGGVRGGRYSLVTLPPPPVSALGCSACAAEDEEQALAALRSPLPVAAGAPEAEERSAAEDAPPAAAPLALTLPAPGEGVRAYLMALPAILDPELADEDDDEEVADEAAAEEGRDSSTPVVVPAASDATETGDRAVAREEEAWDAASAASEEATIAVTSPCGASAAQAAAALASDCSLRLITPAAGQAACSKHPHAGVPLLPGSAAISSGGYPVEFVALILAMLSADPSQRLRPLEALAVLATLAPRLALVQPPPPFVAAQVDPATFVNAAPPAGLLDGVSLLLRLPDVAPVSDAAARAVGVSEAAPVVCWQAPEDAEAAPSTGSYLVTLGDLLDTEGVSRPEGASPASPRRMPAGALAERLTPVLLRRTTGECRLLLAHSTTPVDRLLEVASGTLPGAEWATSGLDLCYTRSGSSSRTPAAPTPAAAGGPFDPKTVCVYVGGCEVSPAVTVASLAKYQPEDASLACEARRGAHVGCFQPTRLPMDANPLTLALSPSPSPSDSAATGASSAFTSTIPSLHPLVLDLIPARATTAASNADLIVAQMAAAEAALGLDADAGASPRLRGDDWRRLPASLLPPKPASSSGLPALLAWLASYGAPSSSASVPALPPAAVKAAVLEGVHYRGLLALTAECNAALKVPSAPFPYVAAAAAAAASASLWANHHEVAAAAVGLARNLTCSDDVETAAGMADKGLLAACVASYFHLWPESYEEADAAGPLAAASAANEAALTAANRSMPYQGLGVPPLLVAGDTAGASPSASLSPVASSVTDSKTNDDAPAAAPPSPTPAPAPEPGLGKRRIHGCDYSLAEDAILSVSNLLRFSGVQAAMAEAYKADPAAGARTLQRATAMTVDAVTRHVSSTNKESGFCHFLTAAVKLLRYLTDVAAKVGPVASSPSPIRVMVEEGALLALCKCLRTETKLLQERADKQATESATAAEDAWHESALDACLRTMCILLLHGEARDVAVCPFKTCAQAVTTFMQAPAASSNASLLSLAATVLRNLACITGISVKPQGQGAPSVTGSPDKREAGVVAIVASPAGKRLLTDAVAPLTSPALILTSSGVAGILEAAMAKHPDCAALQENGRCALLNLALLGANDALEVMRQGSSAWEAWEAKVKKDAVVALPGSASPSLALASGASLSPSLGPRASMRLMGGVSTPVAGGTGLTLPPAANDAPRSDGAGTGDDDAVPVRRGGSGAGGGGTADMGSRLSARFLPGLGSPTTAFLPTPVRTARGGGGGGGAAAAAGIASAAADLPGAAASGSPAKEEPTTARATATGATPAGITAAASSTAVSAAASVTAGHVAVEVSPATAVVMSTASAATAAGVTFCGRHLSPRAVQVLLAVLVLLLVAAIAAAAAGWAR